ncbi:hypothetical protein GOP47_0004589 [Adiantum capillus-veneris]|uniref:Fungal lipase-type domain-containing protein n=1 Tax=Adiantum capillus-veneris TaxID=13818 RepID=A0A9D4V7Q8_ADICA|nr:hypothetical protein GOP47_0004589 [Adiantum capillus-veneris]
MALSLAPSSSNGFDLTSSRCRPLSTNPHRPLRLPYTRSTPRLQPIKTTWCRWGAASAPSPSPSTALDLRNPKGREAYSPSSLSLQSPNRHSPGHLQLDPLIQSLEETFRNSPNGELSKRWQEYHGCSNWAGLLSPLDPDLRAEIIKYGDLAQLTYDAFDNEEGSHTRGECLYEEQELFQRAGLTWTGYTVTKYIYASSDVHVLPKWLESRTGMHGQHESSWIGFIAVANDEKEIARLGRRDIVVVWRGTVTQIEWLEDIDGAMIEPHGISGASHNTTSHGHVGVERGFYTLYTSCNMDAPHGQMSASKQVRDEVKRLVDMYKGQKSQLSITLTGHSLGGALALLASYDVALNCVEKDVPVSVISFAAPRVGNEAFRLRLEEIGVKVLRVVNVHDMVPKVPGIFVHEETPTHHVSSSGPSSKVSHHHNLKWNTYVHVGMELRLDNHFSPFLKKNVGMVDSHNLEVYLHLVDGYRSSRVPFIGLQRREFSLGERGVLNNAHQLDEVRLCMRFMKRDVALINKTTGLLLDELHIQTKWQEKKLPKPSPRLSPSTNSTTRNNFNYLMHELLHSHLESGTNLSVA